MSVDEHLNEAKRRLAQAAATRRGDDPAPLHNPYTQGSVIGQAQAQALVALVEAVQELAATMKPPMFAVEPISGTTIDQIHFSQSRAWSTPTVDNYRRAEQRVESAQRNLVAAQERLAAAEDLLAAAAQSAVVIDTTNPDSWATWEEVPVGAAFKGKGHPAIWKRVEDGFTLKSYGKGDDPVRFPDDLNKIAPFVLADAGEQR